MMIVLPANARNISAFRLRARQAALVDKNLDVDDWLAPGSPNQDYTLLTHMGGCGRGGD